MTRSPLAAVVLVAVVALQLALAGTGAQCVMPVAGTGRVAGSATGVPSAPMAGMRMPSAPADGERSPAGSRDQDAPCDQSPPTAACHGMSSCTASFLASPAADRAAPPPPALRIALAAEVMPPSASAAPEPPPPRA